MKYAIEDRFKGHIHNLDIRGPLTAAGGSTWPTIPAFRMRLGSWDGWGILQWLSDVGILFQMLMPQPGHDAMIWNDIIAPVEVSSALLFRVYTFPNDFYTWAYQIQMVQSGPSITDSWDRPFETNNRDHLVPDKDFGSPPQGGTGTGCTLFQVEYDETEPPIGWPPLVPDP